jgi:hypothetical protein
LRPDADAPLLLVQSVADQDEEPAAPYFFLHRVDAHTTDISVSFGPIAGTFEALRVLPAKSMGKSKGDNTLPEQAAPGSTSTGSETEVAKATLKQAPTGRQPCRILLLAKKQAATTNVESAPERGDSPTLSEPAVDPATRTKPVNVQWRMLLLSPHLELIEEKGFSSNYSCLGPVFRLDNGEQYFFLGTDNEITLFTRDCVPLNTWPANGPQRLRYTLETDSNTALLIAAGTYLEVWEIE